MDNTELASSWRNLLKKLSVQFGDDIDLQAILFLIGVQELGKGYSKFRKDEKLDIMHIAICTLLTPYGYYSYKGKDEEGWPHWEVNERLPALKGLQQEHLMKEAIIDYFTEKEDFSHVLP